jgi:hypothetical protein
MLFLISPISYSEEIDESLVSEYIELTNLKSKYTYSKNEFSKLNEYVENGSELPKDAFSEALSWEKVRPIAMDLISKQYTTDELKMLNALLKTDAGKLLIHKHFNFENKLNEATIPLLMNILE